MLSFQGVQGEEEEEEEGRGDKLLHKHTADWVHKNGHALLLANTEAELATLCRYLFTGS